MVDFIGTAGWNVPARYAEALALPGTHLQRYAASLNAVEINSSFYRAHQRKTYERWARSVPAEFRFAVKLPRAITHENRFAGCRPLLRDFAAQVAGLAAKLAVVLVQLPPSFEFDARRCNGFFAALGAIEAALVCEPRHASWFTERVSEYLAARRIARAAADPACAPAAGEPGGWPGLVYFRLHGSPHRYYSEYAVPDLQRFRAAFDRQRRAGISRWCIFDNTVLGAAFGNACRFAKLKLQ